MLTKQKPRLRWSHYGARYRHDVLDGRRKPGLKQAIADCELKNGKMDRVLKREFMQGWRNGLVTYSVEEIYYLLKVLKADDIEALGNDLQKVVAQYTRTGMRRT